MKLILVALLTVWLQQSWAQDNGETTSTPSAAPELPPPQAVQHPAVRPKPPDDPNKESSSFIGDPENLDPLRARQENLKDDAEPVLEDIRQVLDAPPPVKAEEKFEPSLPKKKPAPKKAVKKTAQKKPKKVKVAKKPPVIRGDDDPDENIEKGFYKNYMRYNAEPTSVEAWSTATLGRSEEVYIVQKGDTLWSISETLFGDSLFWPKIWALNRQGIVNPHFITPGMKVRFFPGSPDDVPTLAVGENPAGGSENAGAQGGFQSSNGNDMSAEMVNGTEASSGKSSFSPPEGTLVATSGDEPTPLPPSIPVYRSARYFEVPRKIEIIDLKEPERLHVQLYVDIFLTDRYVLSDLKISRLGDANLNCMPGEVIQKFEFIRKTAAEEYTILEPLPKVTLDKESKKPMVFLFPYRRIGTISQYADGKLRIKSCNSALSKDLVYVPTSVINSLKTRKVSEKPPQVIGGPDVLNQQYFHDENVIYLDMGNLSFEIGQTFGVISERIDAPAGQVKILDRFGSFALGVVSKESQPIEVGDRVVPQ